MSRLNLRGRVLYNDLVTPVADARVRIYDLDQGGNGNDKIYDDETNRNGEFSGRSKKWGDRNTIRVNTPFGSFSQAVPDFLALRFRIDTQENLYSASYVHKGPYFHIENGSIPIILPIAPPVQKSQREAIHLITLSEELDDLEKTFYEAIEGGASFASSSILGNHYRNLHYLEKQKATLPELARKLEEVASKSSVRAVDLIISPHGFDERIAFYPNKSESMDTVSALLKTIPEVSRRKFRMVFSTACYGESHLSGWIESGFKVASGSEQIYADSLLSFPAFLAAWVGASTFQAAVDIANNSDPLRVQDSLAKTVLDEMRPNSSNKVNSNRKTLGNRNLQISQLP